MPNPENLNPGGTFGNKGGTGRPPNELRAASRESYSAVLNLVQTWIKECENDPEKLDQRIGNLLQALDKTGKFGLGEAQVLLADNVKQAVIDVLADDKRIPDECIPDIAARLSERLSG